MNSWILGLKALKEMQLSLYGILKISKNYWILISAICLVFGDRMLFKANEIVESKVIIMTMLKELSVIMTIFLGKLFFNEKEVIKKLLYSLLIILGVLIMIAF